MNAAKIVARYIHAYCREVWPEKGAEMASTIANGPFIDVFDHKGGGTHKYIPANKLSADLGYPQDAGVYGYWRMHDDSYLLRTCEGPLAVWSGNEGEPAEKVL